MATVLLALAAVLLFITYILRLIQRPQGFPPGPRWLPIVGNMPYLKELSRSLGGQHMAFNKLAKDYNTNVLGLQLGRERAIVVFKYNLVKRVLNSEDFDGRPDNYFIRLRCMGKRRGITCTDGDVWHKQRGFCLRHLRDLGFGKSTMDSLIREETEEILKTLKHRSEVSFGQLIAPAVLNVLWAFCSGERVSQKDVRLERLLSVIRARSRAFDMAGGVVGQLPWLRHIAPDLSGYSLLMKFNKELGDFFHDTIDEHERQWKPGREDDFIYAYLTEMKNEAGEEDSSFTREQLIMVCLDLFLAGSETTSNTMDFALLNMMLNPNVQAKVQAELDASFSKDSFIYYNDRSKTPYTEAVLAESGRLCQVAPIIGPRRAMRDTVVENYIVPKGTTVLINVQSVHKEEDYWKNPEEFMPERFIDSSGQLNLSERLFLFGAGKRRCLGEVLAKACTFVFFANILKNFRLEVRPGDNLNLKPVPGITLMPKPYQALLHPRF